MRTRLVLACCLVASVVSPVGAQKTAATGRVAGSVTCADTNAPARFAVVVLESISAKGETGENAGAATTAVTDLNGQFAMDKVPVGQYLVLGSLAGYLNPLALFEPADLKKMSAETLHKLEALVPVVTIGPNQSATVALRLEHAAEVRGTISYDDGSPAVGLHLQLLHKRPDGALEEARTELFEGTGLFGARTMSDDRGQFRMIGVAPGEYVVEAKFRAELLAVSGVLSGETNVSVVTDQDNAMAIYSGNVFRRKDAKSAKVGVDDVVSGLDITIPIAGLHSVRGTMITARDGHALNAGQVEMRYADDKEVVRRATIDSNGVFVFPYVPEGSYLLQSGSAMDVEIEERHDSNSNGAEERILERYGKGTLPVIVQSDITGLVLAVPLVKPQN